MWIAHTRLIGAAVERNYVKQNMKTIKYKIFEIKLYYYLNIIIS